VRIGMITQWYEPEPGAAAHPTAIARALQQRGHDLEVLTGFPNYPDGRFFPEYRVRLRHTERRDGVKVLRVPLWPSHDDSGMRRALTLTSYAVSASVQALSLRDVDVCLVYLTPATVGLAARVLRRLAGVPYVLYVQDLWPESVLASGFIGHPRAERVVESAINRFCRGLYRHSSGVAAISPGMQQLLVERGVREDRASVVYNWIDESVFRPADRAAENLDGGAFWLMYAGGIGDVQGLETAVDALALLPDRPDVRLALVGDGVAVPRLRERAAEQGVSDRVRFLGSRPMSSMPAVMASADAQLISLRDLPLFHATVPSKTQSVMACGLPAIASVPGDAARLVERAGAGLACTPEDPRALATAMRTMADCPPDERRRMGRAGRDFYEHNLSAQVGARRLEDLLSRAAQRL
jgi:colanic acid biosynthesis glycosyl transferase WcaI